MTLLTALGGIGDEASGLILVAPAKATRSIREAGSFNGTIGGGVRECDGTIEVDLTKMPSTTASVSEVILETTVRKPTSIINMVLDLRP